MSKIAAYLQEHILGEVTIQPSVLDIASTDASVLTLTPEMVVYPRITNDIRKVARFAWQLAEKGHVLPLTARGSGTDQTGAAIGRGVILALPAHMNSLFEFDVRQKLVRVQPGLNAKALSDALSMHGMAIPALPRSAAYSTIGGAVANNASSALSGRYGSMADWVHQLEVVLANGDVLQTGRLSKRDLAKKKGLTGFEGEIYRTIDNLIEDYKELIETKVATDVRDNVGYTSIADVKHKDGSFDLTPLIVGSQGTLGIVSEMILKAEFIGANDAVAVALFSTPEAARDALDTLVDLEPALLEYYDGDLFQAAAKQGKVYSFYSVTDHRAAIVVSFSDINEHARLRKLKKASKRLSQSDAFVVTSDEMASEELLAVRDVVSYTLLPSTKGASAPPLFDGAYVPRERREDFTSAVSALAVKHHVALPLYGHILENLWYTRPTVQLQHVGDKQKIFKLLDEFAGLVADHGGHLIGEAGEGRVKTHAAYKQLDDDVLELFAAIKTAFDPQGILNPGVKQVTELRYLVAQLRPDYTLPRLADQTLAN